MTSNLPFLINQTDTVHSSRAYVGFHQAFNKEVQLSAGLEYLQGFGGSGGGPPAIPPGYTAATVDPVSISLHAARINFDTLLAANVGAGFSLGVGYTIKYNSAPLPGKEHYDQAGTVAIIYTFSSAAPAPKPPPPPCAPLAPLPPPTTPAAPAPASAPAPAPTPATPPPAGP